MNTITIEQIIDRTADETTPYIWDKTVEAADLFANVLYNEVTTTEELRTELLENSDLHDRIWAICEGELSDKALIESYAARFDIPADAETTDGESLLFETLRTKIKEAAIRWADRAAATCTTIIKEANDRAARIQNALAGDPQNVDAHYKDGQAVVLYKDTDGYWTNRGYNEFCDDNETAQTIIWNGGEYHGSEDDGRTAFDKLVASYTN